MVIQHDDYDQYFIAVEQTLMMETTDVATVIFLMLGSHYIFNLNYHPKVNDISSGKSGQNPIRRISHAYGSSGHYPHHWDF